MKALYFENRLSKVLALKLARQFYRRAMLGPLSPTIYGPQPAGVPKIRGQFRWQVLLLTSQAGAIQQIVFPQMESLSRDISSDVLADVDPITLI